MGVSKEKCSEGTPSEEKEEKGEISLFSFLSFYPSWIQLYI